LKEKQMIDLVTAKERKWCVNRKHLNIQLVLTEIENISNKFSEWIFIDEWGVQETLDQLLTLSLTFTLSLRMNMDENICKPWYWIWRNVWLSIRRRWKWKWKARMNFPE
jgi:hypothetical protein